MGAQGPGALTPTCDRCGKVAAVGGVMDAKTLQFICFDCLTNEERSAFARGETPFAEGGDA